MYIFDKKVKQDVLTYIKYKYDVEFDSNFVYIFNYDYSSITDGEYRNQFFVKRYKDYFPKDYEKVPEEIKAKDVVELGMLLERKDKIEKIKSKYEQVTI